MRVESEDQPLTKEDNAEDVPLAKEQQAEDEPRDPHLDGIERHDSLWATWFLLFRNFIGISSLGVATYFQEVGITWSIFILAGATLLCYYGNSLFCKAADKTNFRDKRMESLMGLHFGEAGYLICATVVLIVQSCLFINTFIIYAEYIEETVCDDLQWDSICFKRWQWLMIFFAIEAPLIAFVKQMNFFTYLALPSCVSLISLCTSLSLPRSHSPTG